MMFDKRNSVYVGNLGSIPLMVHWSFLFLVYMVFNRSTGGGGFDLEMFLIVLVVLLAGIILHELGHGLAAKAQGAVGITITLWAMGGLCSSTRDSLPRREIVILAAGPAVSFLLAWGGYIAFKALAINDPTLLIADPADAKVLKLAWNEYPIMALVRFVTDHGTLVGKVIVMTMTVNLTLGIFNIMPIYPLDGGQIVFQTMRLFMRDHLAGKISLSLAIVAAMGYFAWDFHQSQQFNTYLAVLLTMLLYNAYQYLR